MPLGIVIGWALVVALLIWAGRNKDRILAWYMRRALQPPPQQVVRIRDYTPPPPPE